jgi:hypothetical protein
MPLVWYGVKYVIRLSKLKKIIVCILFGAYLFCLTAYTIKHIAVWQSNETLKKDVRELLEQREKDALTH